MAEFELWPFQKTIFKEARASLRRYRSIGIVMPTGSGKTAVSAKMALDVHKQVGGRNGSALYLVHRKELLDQTANTMDVIGLGDSYGFIAAGRPAKPWAPIQIGSIPTFVSRMDRELDWLDPTVIFVDEGHHATAYTWAKIIKNYPKAFVIFLTATPMRNDDSGLGDIIDHLVLGPQIKELVPEYLSATQTFAVPPSWDATSSSLKAQAEQQTSAVIAASVDNWQRISPNGLTIFFAVNVDHSQLIVEQLKSRGISAAHVDYKTPPAERESIFKGMKEGRIQCVSNVKLFTEGTDWPECDTVVLARNTGSLVDYRQMNGRQMRRKHDGRAGKVIDLAGNVYIHGMPDDDIEWELDYGTDLKTKKNKASPDQVCEMCSYIYPKVEPSCPLCGTAPIKPTIMEVDQEVSEVKGVNGTGGKRSKPTKRQLSDEIVATGGDLDELKKLRARYGYNARWPKRMKEIYKFAWAKEKETTQDAKR